MKMREIKENKNIFNTCGSKYCKNCSYPRFGKCQNGEIKCRSFSSAAS
jgi:hypothetical protein